jgi:hypothetical protein
MKQHIKSNNKPNKIFTIFILLLFLIVSQAAASYKETKRQDNLSISSEGFVIRKIKGDNVVSQLVQPDASLQIINQTSNPRKIELKITNISPVKYSVLSKFGAKTSQGKKNIVYTLNIPPRGVETIKVAPILSDPNKFTFAVLGDTRYGVKIHQGILKEIEKSGAIFAVSVGDVVYKENKGGFEFFTQEIADFSLPYFITPGNHETNNSRGREYFEQYMNPLNYDFKMGKYNFIILDDTVSSMPKERQNWLCSVLSSTTNNFVFAHIPPFSPWRQHRGHNLSDYNAKNFMDLMTKYKVPITFHGHIHGHNETVKNGVRYTITGCAGSFPYVLPSEGGYLHYMLINVDGDKFKTQIRKYRLLKI